VMMVVMGGERVRWGGRAGKRTNDVYKMVQVTNIVKGVCNLFR
jgi:hypothetical protein